MAVLIESRLDDSQVMRKLRRLADRGKDLTPVMAAFGDHLIQETVGRFETERDPEGQPWEPLAAVTLAMKKNDSILSESTDLRNSFSRKAGKRSVKMGTDRPYAAVHQWGLKRTLKIKSHRRRVKSRDRGGKASGVGFVRAHDRKVDTQARSFLGFTDHDENVLAETVKEYLLDR